MSDPQGNALATDDAGYRPSRTVALVLMGLILLLCAAIRLWIISHSSMIARDGVTYLELAQDFRRDPVELIRTSHYHPGYPAAVALAYGLMGGEGGDNDRAAWERAGQAVALAAAMAGLAAVAILASMAFDLRIALFTVLLFGCGSKWAELGSNVLSDTLAIAFQLWAVVAALAALGALRLGRRRALAAAAAVGLCAGAGYWVRGEAALVAPAAAVLWLLYAAGRQVRWRRAIVASALTILVALLGAMPYMIAIGGITRKHVLGTEVPQLRAATAPALPPAAERDDPPPALLALAGRISEAAHPAVAALGALWAVAWGLDRLRRRPPAPWIPRPARPAAIIAAIVVAASMPVLAVHYRNTGILSSRYVMFIAALLAPLGGAGLVVLVRLPAAVAAPLRRSRRAATALTAVLLVGTAGGMAAHAMRPLHADSTSHRLAGEHLARLRLRIDPQAVIVSDSPWVRHYAGPPAQPLPARRLSAALLRDRLGGIEAPCAYLALTAEARRRDRATAALLTGPAFGLIEWTDPSPSPDEALTLYRVDLSALVPSAAAE
ncbi:MAG: hypothetical protein GX591_13360 [Planctomycetes bacterium]|nr:hypothetical protein [Planctomycetota bacterium]